MVTRLKDIAAKAGFSVNTVSLALRDSPRIPEETRTTIKTIARNLNYTPNEVAKSLVARETRTVGLILTSVTNPVLAQVAHQVERWLSQKGYGTLFASSNNDPDEEQRVIDMFRARRVDGILAYPCNHQDLERFRQLRAGGMPVVMLVDDPEGGVDSVAIDEPAGAEKAVAHLLALGHRRIGLLDAASSKGNIKKRAGYLAALAKAGVTPEPDWIIDPREHSLEAGRRALGELLARKTGVTAVFAVNDMLALGAAHHAVTSGLRLPEDLAIVGFDNIDFARLAMIPLTSIQYEVEQLVDGAAARVLELIARAADLPPPQNVQIDPALMVRASTQPKP
ncbi:LacI family DNA-binding transcriptional regulator [Neogemmobacter tilapiae]|nr:LacI family DNA-binding transcriptional regulator [Gemmobacter tilapiae]